MASNLPPGVTDSMIPGNRPEDREVKVTLVLSVGDIDDLRNADIKNDENLRITLAIILEQIDEQIWRNRREQSGVLFILQAGHTRFVD